MANRERFLSPPSPQLLFDAFRSLPKDIEYFKLDFQAQNIIPLYNYPVDKQDEAAYIQECEAKGVMPHSYFNFSWEDRYQRFIYNQALVLTETSDQSYLATIHGVMAGLRPHILTFQSAKGYQAELALDHLKDRFLKNLQLNGYSIGDLTVWFSYGFSLPITSLHFLGLAPEEGLSLRTRHQTPPEHEAYIFSWFSSLAKEHKLEIQEATTPTFA